MKKVVADRRNGSSCFRSPVNLAGAAFSSANHWCVRIIFLAFIVTVAGFGLIRNVSGALALGYSTYLGGGSDDAAAGAAVDASGNVYIAGTTYSPDFPTTTGAIKAFTGSQGAFVAKF